MRPRLESLLVACSITMLLALSACGGGDGETNTPTPTVELTGLAREIFDALEQGTQATYRASYQTTDPDGNAGDTFVVFNTASLTRIDTVALGQQEAREALIGGGTDDRTIGCSGGPDAWTCSEIDPLGNSLLRAAGPIGFYSASDLASFSIQVANARTVSGQTTTCYTLTPNGEQSMETSEYCFTDQGVVLYASTPSRTVEAVDFATEVNDQEFDPPAEPD